MAYRPATDVALETLIEPELLVAAGQLRPKSSLFSAKAARLPVIPEDKRVDVRFCAGFRMPAMQEKPSARCPASESRQRTNPRAMVRGPACGSRGDRR
jgi:hypothetical protein